MYAMYEGHPHRRWFARATSLLHERTYVSTFRMSSVAAIANTPSENVSSRPVSTVTEATAKRHDPWLTS